MGIFTWIIVGGIAGWLATRFIKSQRYGLGTSIIIGVLGALLGGWLAGQFFHISNAISGFNIQTLLIAFLGSVIVLYIFRLLKI